MHKYTCYYVQMKWFVLVWFFFKFCLMFEFMVVLNLHFYLSSIPSILILIHTYYIYKYIRLYVYLILLKLHDYLGFSINDNQICYDLLCFLLISEIQWKFNLDQKDGIRILWIFFASSFKSTSNYSNNLSRDRKFWISVPLACLLFSIDWIKKIKKKNCWVCCCYFWENHSFFYVCWFNAWSLKYMKMTEESFILADFQWFFVFVMFLIRLFIQYNVWI